MGSGHTEPTCPSCDRKGAVLSVLSQPLQLFLCSLPAAVPDGSESVCLSCSGAGVCTDNHNRGGDDGDGGGDHVSAEPLQTLCTLLHQPAQPGQAARREPLLSKSHPALPATRARWCLALASSDSVIGGRGSILGVPLALWGAVCMDRHSLCLCPELCNLDFTIVK